MTKIKQGYVAKISMLILIQIVKVFFQALLEIKYNDNKVSISLIFFVIIIGLILLFYYVIQSFQKFIINNGEYVVRFTSFPKMIFEYISIIVSRIIIYLFLVALVLIIYWFISRILGYAFHIEMVMKSRVIKKILLFIGYIWIFPFMYIIPIISIKRTNYKTKEIRKQSLQIIKKNIILSFALYIGLLIVNLLLPLVIIEIPNAQIIRNSIISVYLVLYYIIITSVYCRSFHN